MPRYVHKTSCAVPVFFILSLYQLICVIIIIIVIMGVGYCGRMKLLSSTCRSGYVKMELRSKTLFTILSNLFRINTKSEQKIISGVS